MIHDGTLDAFVETIPGGRRLTLDLDAEVAPFSVDGYYGIRVTSQGEPFFIEQPHYQTYAPGAVNAVVFGPTPC